MATTYEQYQAAEAAYLKALQAQAVSDDATSITRANINSLYNQMVALKAQYLRESGTGGMKRNTGYIRRG